MQRWDPWSDIVSLREAMNSLLEDSFVRSRGGTGSRVGGSLAVDVKEKEDSYEIRASVPGVKPEDVDVSVLGDTVRIRGQFESERRNDQNQGQQGQEQNQNQGTDGSGGQQGERWLIRERRAGSFERIVTLPSAVNSDQATAEFQDGVLTVTLPKAEEAKPRSIPVGGKPHEIDVESHGSKQSDKQENKKEESKSS